MPDETVQETPATETAPCKCECCDHVPAEIEKPKASWIWMKDANGAPSVTVTFASVSFWVTTFAFLLSIVEKLGPLEIRAFDVGACSAYMVPILGLYFGRRWTDAKFGPQK